MERRFISFASIILAFCVASCQTTSRINSAAMFTWTSPSKRVVLVQPDVQLSELDAGGLLEPRADWTETARGFIDKDIRDHFAKSNAEVVAADHSTPRDVQLTKLHGAIGQAILVHLYVPDLKLPNKGNALDWSLGPGTNEMRDRYGADYAMFVFVRDSYSSSGRRALQVFGALAGISVQGGVQVGFASLVDLRTGNIVWFNRLISGTGDMRTERPAQRTVDELIKDIPI